LGGSYNALASDQPVLPVLNAVMKDGAGYDMSVIFAYDFQPALHAVVRVAGVDACACDYSVGGGGWTTYPMQPAEYLFVLVIGPGEGSADGIFRVHGAADVLATQAGEAFWARGLDGSETALDVFGAGTSGYVRTWQYSGHEAPLAVQGQLFGYVGYHFPTEAHWVAPDGGARLFVLGGEAGAWTASFPEESFTGPVCAGFCLPPFGDAREDPPFAIGADVTI
jgi:hypothetical protein